MNTQTHIYCLATLIRKFRLTTGEFQYFACSAFWGFFFGTVSLDFPKNKRKNEKKREQEI